MSLFYVGPKLYVKPTQKSNRSIIINAVSHCCLAGHVNKDKVDKALEVCHCYIRIVILILCNWDILQCRYRFVPYMALCSYCAVASN